uniref:Small ubiquitin-related modifier 2-A n=1 Tax=Aceria tosichella TaxID=561515 RepID=A0A6G1SFA2_9ACAR
MNIEETEVVTLDDSSSDSRDTVLLDDSSDDDDRIIDNSNPQNNSSNIFIQEEKSQKSNDRVPSNDDSVQINNSVQNEASFEDYDYNLKLMRHGNFEQYKTTWRTKLSVALKDLIEDLAKSGKSIILTKRDGTEPVSLDGTPHSLNLDSGTILNAIVIYQSQQPHHSGSTSRPVHDPNVITLKLQDGQRKHLKEFKIAKQEPLSILKEKYAQEFNIDLNRMKLCFDGDPVDDQDTPDSLDIEDECVIDVIVSP